MPDITTQLKAAIGEEPPLGFRPADVIATAHRVRRHRRSRYAAGAAGVAVAVTVGTMLALPGSGADGTSAGNPPDGHATELSLTSLSRIAGTQSAAAPGVSPSARVDGVTAAEVFSLFEQDTGLRLTETQASLLRPPGELDLAAGLAVSGHPYLNIQVTPSRTMSTAMPTCAELSDLASGSGDGYYGPCAIRRLADGSVLVVRSGETRQGHFTMAQATLIRPDGSGVFAEDTNQALATASGRVVKDKSGPGGKPALPPVVSVNPPVNANTLAVFVRDVAAHS
jgi:hypothetical protein